MSLDPVRFQDANGPKFRKSQQPYVRTPLLSSIVHLLTECLQLLCYNVLCFTILV
jgi:hypothetical protein